MTGEYNFLVPERQSELTRRIQLKLAQAGETRRVDPCGPQTRIGIVGGHSSSRGSFLSIMVGRQEAMLKILGEQH